MRLQVKEHRPLRTLSFIAATVLMLTISIWLVLDYDQWQYIKGRIAENAERKELWVRNQELEKENQHVREKLAILERNKDINQRAYQDIQDTLMELQTTISEQKSELAFFHAVVAASADVKGFKVQDMRMQAIGDAGYYQFNLLLTHMAKGNNKAKGKLTIEVLGQDEKGNNKKIAWKQLMDEQAPIGFEFAHFQLVAETISLPASFSPDQIRVLVTTEGRKKSKVLESVFNWQEVLN